MLADINCDMGESFSLYRMGNDEELMPWISEANIACGFHGSDPNHMRTTVQLAKRFDVAVGAHVSLPDLAGFGRREMKIDRDELANIIIYQIGALSGFLAVEGLALNHVKPHGALYGMAARERQVAEAVADAVACFNVPVLGLAGTLHEEIYTARGLTFRAEFFADLDYDADGKLLITRQHSAVDAVEAGRRAKLAVSAGKLMSTAGTELPVRAQTVCVHSDTPNAVEVARAVHEALKHDDE